jgi:hypothetical protein
MVELISDKVRSYLIGNGYSNVSIYELQDTGPGTPASQIVIIPTGGYQPDGHFGGTPRDRPRLTIMVFDDDLEDAEATAEALRQLFIDNLNLSGCLRARTINSHISYLGRDETTSRFKFSFDVETYI